MAKSKNTNADRIATFTWQEATEFLPDWLVWAYRQSAESLRGDGRRRPSVTAFHVHENGMVTFDVDVYAGGKKEFTYELNLYLETDKPFPGRPREAGALATAFVALKRKRIEEAGRKRAEMQEKLAGLLSGMPALGRRKGGG